MDARIKSGHDESGANMRKVNWLELTTEEFASLDPEKTIAVLPIAAIEQHGPHLAVSTDTIIGQGMVDAVIAKLPTDLGALFLPVQSVGKSNEHIRSPGTITYSAETAQRVWQEIGESVARAGLRKMVMVTSHGGNVDTMRVVARELRVNCQMLVVTTGWRFGVPKDLFAAPETLHGIHGGDIETSLMLHFRPDLVRKDKAKNFVPSSVRMENEFKFLRPTGLHAHGWIAQDIHPDGAAGDASIATAEKGKQWAEFQAERFIELLRDVERFELSRLA
jgi:creatinine amidohydrolase